MSEMRRRSLRALFLPAVECLVLIALSVGFVRASEPRLHLLAVGDTLDRDIGQSVAVDLYHVDELFKANVPESRLSITIMKDDEIEPRSVVSRIRDLNIESGVDTVVFYYSGHGAFSTRSNEHVFQPGGKRLNYLEVESAVRHLHPRLAVLISDACSVFLITPVPAPAYPPAVELSPAFKSLFFDPKGIIFISASKPTEEAGCNSNGGYFTTALSTFLHENKERALGWPAVLRRVNARVSATNRNARQTAYFAVHEGQDFGAVDERPNSGSGSKRVRFGIVAERTARSARYDGVEVLRVEPNSPAMALRSHGDGRQYYLVPGRDIITHVNGTAVTTNEEIVAAVNSSPPKMVVRVFDTQTGVSEDYDVRLDAAD